MAGKHVILEKPAASNTEELQRLVQLAEKQKRMLFEAMNIHALPSYRALKEDLAGIGRPRLVCLNFSQYSSRYDAFLQGDVHPVFEPEQGWAEKRLLRERAQLKKAIDTLTEERWGV